MEQMMDNLYNTYTLVAIFHYPYILPTLSLYKGVSSSSGYPQVGEEFLKLVCRDSLQ